MFVWKTKDKTNINVNGNIDKDKDWLGVNIGNTSHESQTHEKIKENTYTKFREAIIHA